MCGLCGDLPEPGIFGVGRRGALRLAAGGAALGLLAACSAKTQEPRAAPPPEPLLLHGGRVLTRAVDGRVASAVAVRDGRIVAVGTDDEAAGAAGPGARTVELNGRTVIPGLNDSHIHAARLALDRPNVALVDARSIADVLAAVGARTAAAPAGQWVQGQACWHESLLAERRMPTAAELDRVSPRNPVFLPRGGHVAAVNGRALALAGIGRNTPDPPGGVIVRDGRGEPTGVLLEKARTLVARLLPPPPPEAEQRGLLREELAELNAQGITSITEPGLAGTQLAGYEALHRAGELTMRTHLLGLVASLADVARAVGTYRPRQGPDDLLRFDGLKYLADGGVEGARLTEPYQVVPGEQADPNYRGLMLLPPGGLAELREMYRRAARHGFQVQTHVVGDETIGAVLGVLEEVNRELPLEPLRWVLMHLFLPGADHLAAMRRIGLLGTLQDHPVLLGGNQVRWWGRPRAERAIPVRQILDAGIRCGGGSDAPASVPSPWRALAWLATRRTLGGEVLGPDQCVTPAEALHLYTEGSAHTQFAERLVGAVEPGRLADLAVLDRDYLATPAEQIAEIRAELTVLGGRIVHQV